VAQVNASIPESPLASCASRGLTRICRVAATLLDGDGQPRSTVQQLRHTRGTQMVQDGHALHIVQRALGHKDPRSTQLYADVTEDDVRRALEMRR
jgi:site-specific recombinase XerD